MHHQHFNSHAFIAFCCIHCIFQHSLSMWFVWTATVSGDKFHWPGAVMIAFWVTENKKKKKKKYGRSMSMLYCRKIECRMPRREMYGRKSQKGIAAVPTRNNQNNQVHVELDPRPCANRLPRLLPIPLGSCFNPLTLFGILVQL